MISNRPVAVAAIKAAIDRLCGETYDRAMVQGPAEMKRIAWVILAAAACLAGCKSAPPPPAPHPRIISYSPAVTDILYDLGLGPHVIGVTGWCIVPEGFGPRIVGDVTNPNTEAILALEPDLIIIQQDPSKFDPLRSQNPRIRVLSVKTDSLEGIIESVQTIAQAAGVEAKGAELAGGIRKRLDDLRRRWQGQPRPRVLFVMGFDHPGTVGKDTYLDELITIAGGQNVAEGLSKWPTINAEMIMNMKPDVLICQVNPGEGDNAMKYWQGLGAIPAVAHNRVYVTTDKRMTIFGSRIADAAETLARFIHAEPSTQPATQGSAK